MKKILFIALLIGGMYTSSQAQTLQYWIYNTDNVMTWDFKMDDFGGAAPVYELGIAPNTNRVGVMGPAFAWPLEWKASSNFGCSATDILAGPIPFMTTPSSCPGIDVNYKAALFSIVPFVVYGMKMELE